MCVCVCVCVFVLNFTKITQTLCVTFFSDFSSTERLRVMVKVILKVVFCFPFYFLTYFLCVEVTANVGVDGIC